LCPQTQPIIVNTYPKSVSVHLDAYKSANKLFVIRHSIENTSGVSCQRNATYFAIERAGRYRDTVSHLYFFEVAKFKNDLTFEKVLVVASNHTERPFSCFTRPSR